MLKRLSSMAATVLLLSMSFAICQPLCQPAVANQLLKKISADAADPKNWEYFDYTAYPDKTLLVPRPEALQHSQLVYPERPSFPYNPTTTPTLYGRGKDQAPTLVFVKAGDPVILEGKVYWSSMVAEESKQILLNSGEAVDIWSVSAYTPLFDYSGIANIADIQPWKPERVFKKGNWQDLIFTDANEAITISGQAFTAPAAGEKVVVKVKDKEGKSHQVTLWSVAANFVQPNKPPKPVAPVTTIKKKKKKKVTTPGAETPASTTPAATPPAATTPATTPPATPAAAPATTPPPPKQEVTPPAAEKKSSTKEPAVVSEEKPKEEKKSAKEAPAAEEKPAKEEAKPSAEKKEPEAK